MNSISLTTLEMVFILLGVKITMMMRLSRRQHTEKKMSSRVESSPVYERIRFYFHKRKSQICRDIHS